MPTPTPGQTAMTLITAAADPLNAGPALAALLGATLQHDLDEQGHPLAQVEHLTRVNAKLAAVAAMFARTFAQQTGTPLEVILQQLATSDLITGGGEPDEHR